MTQIGQYIKLNDAVPNLILHITTKLLRNENLTSFKQEELLLIQHVCTSMLSHGIKILLLRESLYNSGIGDIVILNRKISNNYWFRIFSILKQHSDAELLRHMFNESHSAYISKKLHYSGNVSHMINFLFMDEFGVNLKIPEELICEGNIVFSVGAIYNHRLLKICRFFNRFWGDQEREPTVRLICKHLWFAYLIMFGKFEISTLAYNQQRAEHKAGLFSFLQNDFKVFCGMSENPQLLDSSAIFDLTGISAEDLFSYE
ncbi:U52 [Human betaherpesvirus 6A]|uniref:U52 n=2 Tax=root TaxID=1 RepID=A0A126LAZ5_HUMAN|nr:U52 [Human betaherpesvirus 6A]AMD82183.1 U52 [Homo sapiens]AHK06912.1 U52 [Human betaherpesvirus 6A]AJA36266.1 U52 [Human betaherpesvirus 6A]AVI07365.1 hypothetical protein [Human betaherpesvirus 6A]